MPDSPPPDVIAPRVAELVAWHLVADLLRRHDAHQPLRVVDVATTAGEVGPGLFDAEGGAWPGAPIGWLRGHRWLEGTRAGGHGVAADPVAAWLRADDPGAVVAAVEAALALPPPMAPWAPPTRGALAARVMAATLAHGVADAHGVRWRCLVRVDGGGGAPPRVAPVDVPGLRDPEPDAEGLRRAARCWSLAGGGEGRGGPTVIDLPNAARWCPRSGMWVDLAEAWRRRPSVLHLVADVLGAR